MDYNVIKNSLESLFLDYKNEDIKSLLHKIEILNNSIPNDRDEPYFGNLDDEHDFLIKFDSLENLPKNSDDLLKDLGRVFSGMLKWHHPRVMHNVIPSPILGSVAASTIASLYNLNPIWDFISGGTQKMEKQVAKILAQEIGWNNNSSGVSTFGGKGCIIYALRIGLNRSINNVSTIGLNSLPNSPIVITSKENHYCIDTAASLLGIGKKNVWRAEVHENETMDLDSFEFLIDKALNEKHPIAAIVVCGGSSLHLTIDDLKGVSNLVEKYVKKYKLRYKPFIYFDTCVGWPWVFYLNYDFNKNILSLSPELITILKKAVKKLTPIYLSDAFGVDFHKTGFCSYSTSMFICKNGSELTSIYKDKIIEDEIKSHGDNFLHHYTIEHSRSSAPIVSAWYALHSFGRQGFQSYLASMISVANEIRKILPLYGIEFLNPFSLSYASVFFATHSSETILYEELFKIKADKVFKCNKYQFSLFKFFQNKSINKESSFIFRFVPQYRQSIKGENMAVLVIFPMSLNTSVNDACDLAHQIGKIKIKFDKEYSESVNSVIPKHVIK
jgi:L-2,4-diaminobutyrate decarboxylase